MFHSITGFCVVDSDMARQIEGLIHENVVDPSLREWIMPKFTTTTPNDLIISSIITLSSLQESFSYRRKKGRHGLPAVTLLRKKGDWEKMLDKTQRVRRGDYSMVRSTQADPYRIRRHLQPPQGHQERVLFDEDCKLYTSRMSP